MKLKKDVLYCGDRDLTSGAAYLGGIMDYFDISFDHVPMHESLPEELIDREYKLFLLSDYPSENIPERAVQNLTAKVKQGASLLMIGGWESFHGLVGNYHTSELAQVLPVICLEEDDRVNYCQGLIPEVTTANEITADLPWNEPFIFCGYNRVKPKTDSTVVLSLRKLKILDSETSLDEQRAPMLVVGSFGSGKTGALTTDVAPHWSGGMVDWGTERIKAQAEGGIAIEVGKDYALFIKNLIRYFL
ncbi:MAG: hypothetical protein JSV89_11385 [Spirochaetaceae bacterium]|nr:MAG: hypothetical protein JSV89_11385 [Spirochaetaceae bacterium]